MKKKKTLYMMLPLVLLVWGFVFYQLFGSFFGTPNYAKEEIKQEVNIDEIKKDTFLIVADYRDPFLGKKIRTKKTISSSQGTKPKGNNRAKMPKAEKPWPSISFKGMIKNNNSDRRVGILNVNGKEFLIKEKDIVNDVTIVSIAKSTVEVRFQKESKTITK